MSDTVDNTLTAYLGPEFQQRLMWQLLVEPEFAEKTIPDLAIEYFDDPNLKRLFIIVLEFIKEYGKVPNLQNQSIFQAINKYKTPNNIIEEESLFSVIKRIDLWNERVINKSLFYDGDVVQKATIDFIRQQEYRKLGEHILAKTKNGEIKNKYVLDEFDERFQKIQRIGDKEDDGTEVIDGIDHALRKEFRQTIPTGIEAIDVLTGGGLGKGEIGLILTPTGVGKTTALTKIANTAYEDGKYVAQVIFEDTEDQIKRKHYTIWSEIALSDIDNDTEKVNNLVREKVSKLKGKGKLIIKRFSQENTTMKDIRNWMLKHEKKYGIKFDLLVLDYLDCVDSHKKTPDRNEAELVIIKSFEALASDFDIPAWSAIQTNRTGIDAELVEAHQSGGNIKRIQKAHFFMSVAKTPDQKEAHLANVRIIKARFAQDGQTFKDCIFNNNTMQIIINDPRYKYGDKFKGVKHHDSDDIDKLELKVEKISEIDFHAAISNREDTLLDMVNDESINNSSSISEFDNPKKDIDIIEKFELDTENKIIENNIDVVNDGVIDVVNDGDKDIVNWTGETETIKPSEVVEINIENELTPILVDEVKETPIIKSISIEKNNSNDINNIVFDDPDLQSDNKTYNMLIKMRENQNVIKRE